MQASTARAISRSPSGRAPSSRERSFLLSRLVPDRTEAFLRRRLREFGGIVQILLAAAMVAALFTYFPGDPSWDSALPSQWLTRIHNVLGMIGAFYADPFIQTLGLAAYLLPVAITIWGIRQLRHRGQAPLWLRLVILFPTLILASAVLAPLRPLQSWQLATTLGGSVGQALLGMSTGALAGSLGHGAKWVAWFGLSLLAVVLLSATLGVGYSEWRRTGGIGIRGVAWTLRRARVIGRNAEPEPVRVPPAPSPRAEPERPPGSRTAAAAGAAAVAAAAGPSIRERRPPRIGGRKPEPPDPRQSALPLPEPTDYMLPPVDLLQTPPPESRSPELTDEFLRKNAEALSGVLADFGVKGEIVDINPGPVVTLYELEPAPGTKSSRVIGLADDIARSMSALAVRVAVVPGRNVIGIELPNQKRDTVFMRSTLEHKSYHDTPFKLPLILGKDISGEPVVAELAKMPHLLVAGTTGSGKSVAINTMILSLLYKLPPERCRFIMVDPKMLELSVYEGIPHLLTPVVTEPKKAVVALKWTVREMEDRYRAMSKLGVRNVEGFNLRLAEAREKGELLTRKVQTGFDADTGKPVFEDQAIDLKELPYIVVIVDEFADLMLVAGKEIEAAIQRLAQMARAAGIHLIMATQRPSVDVITGTIKANFPTRISFQVTSKIDSRTILGESGAEQLLGQGDMLYMAAGGRVTRVHGPFVRDQEVEKVVAYLKTQGEPDYIDEVTEDDSLEGDGDMPPEEGGSGDELYDQAVALVAREGKASTSFVQRHLQIGYNKAAKLIEKMEKEGVVSTANHVGKREVLIAHHGGD